MGQALRSLLKYSAIGQPTLGHETQLIMDEKWIPKTKKRILGDIGFSPLELVLFSIQLLAIATEVVLLNVQGCDK